MSEIRFDFGHFLKLLNSFKAEKATSTLTLSYEELKHIRSALSRHKLESLCDPDLKAEIEKGSVCFHCYKTKFSLFFNRKQQCQLCLRNICSRCISKVRFLNKARLPLFIKIKVNCIQGATDQHGKSICLLLHIFGIQSV